MTLQTPHEPLRSPPVLGSSTSSPVNSGRGVAALAWAVTAVLAQVLILAVWTAPIAVFDSLVGGLVLLVLVALVSSIAAIRMGRPPTTGTSARVGFLLGLLTLLLAILEVAFLAFVCFWFLIMVLSG